jgi:hypothetical protein
MFRECPVYHQPPSYRHNPEDMYGDDDDAGGSADVKLPGYVSRIFIQQNNSHTRITGPRRLLCSFVLNLPPVVFVRSEFAACCVHSF